MCVGPLLDMLRYHLFETGANWIEEYGWIADKQDFEALSLSETNSEGTMFSYPPLPWIGARFKFDVRDLEGNALVLWQTEPTAAEKDFVRGCLR